VSRAADAGPAVVWKHYAVRSPSTDKIERFWIGHAASIKAAPGAGATADPRLTSGAGQGASGAGQGAPGASQGAAATYPVIYFLPGLLDDEDNWKSALDPHLGKHEIIAVCPAVGGATWFMNSPAQPWMRWGDFLTEDLRGFVESQYPAARQKGQRGIIGISAGGHAAFYHAIKRLDLYGSVSVLSGAMDLRGYAGAVGLDYWIGPRLGETTGLYADRSCLVLAGRLAGPLPFDLFLDAGDKDGALPQMQALKNVLENKGISARWFVGQGGHNWSYWPTRAADHLAWHAELFARNRREGRFTEVAPAKAAELTPVKDWPQIALSPDALARLRAPWAGPGGKSLAVTGLPKGSGPLSKTDPQYKEVVLTATTDAHGHRPGLFLYRLTLVASTPLPRDGTITLTPRLRSGRGQSLFGLPAATLPVPAGAPDRRVELRLRLAVEFKSPDPLRGGIAAAVQVFDADGKPVGDPLANKAGPGTPEIERYPTAAQIQAEWTATLAGDKALPVAAIHEARLEAEPPTTP
jgi:S-formylglutathione hydrolase FrmB